MSSDNPTRGNDERRRDNGAGVQGGRDGHGRTPDGEAPAPATDERGWLRRIGDEVLDRVDTPGLSRAVLKGSTSFAEWAVKHGHSVFAISYRNPDASMRLRA